MPETSSKISGRGKNDKSLADKYKQFTLSQVETLLQTVDNKLTTTLTKKINALKP